MALENLGLALPTKNKYLMFNLSSLFSIWISLSCSWWLVSSSLLYNIVVWPTEIGLNQIDYGVYLLFPPLFTCRFQTTRNFFWNSSIFFPCLRKKTHTHLNGNNQQQKYRSPREPLSVISQHGVFMVIELKRITPRPVSFFFVANRILIEKIPNEPRRSHILSVFFPRLLFCVQVVLRQRCISVFLTRRLCNQQRP